MEGKIRKEDRKGETHYGRKKSKIERIIRKETKDRKNLWKKAADIKKKKRK